MNRKLKTNMLVIRNAHDDQLFWSNSHGWVESPNEDYFTQEERKTLMLPFDGVWVSVVGDS